MERLIPKKSGTYADALHAVGLASLMEEMTGASARIIDRGSEYCIAVTGGLPSDKWKPPSPGFMYIWRKSDAKDVRPAQGYVLDYEVERAIAEGNRKQKAASKARSTVAEAVQEVSEEPLPANDAEYRFATIIESMRKGWSSDKILFRWIIEQPEDARDTARAYLLGETSEPNVDWSNSQLLNPSTGKGVHSAKTIAKSAGGFNLVAVTEEWMKLRGLGLAMLAFRSGEDFKFYVLDPADIAISDLRHLRDSIRDRGFWGIAKLDIQALLEVLKQLMIHSDFDQGDIPVYRRRPNDILRGLRLSFFKSLGTAAALMNDSFLPLPHWFVIEDRQDVQAYQTIASEPFGKKGAPGPLAALKEEHSDDMDLLQKYRRWLTSGELVDLLEFHSSFGRALLQRLAAKDFAVAFKTEILHLLLSKGYDYVKEIIESKGFQNIARAIRNTTLYAVSMPNSKREVQFGLAQKLKQRIKAGDDEFLAEISRFVQHNNWEIAHRLEGSGHQVTTLDLDELVALTSKYKAELVGMLLLAYGYSRAESVSDKNRDSEEVARTT